MEKIYNIRISDMPARVVHVGGEGTPKVIRFYGDLTMEDREGKFDKPRFFELPVPFDTPLGKIPAEEINIILTLKR